MSGSRCQYREQQPLHSASSDAASSARAESHLQPSVTATVLEPQRHKRCGCCRALSAVVMAVAVL